MTKKDAFTSNKTAQSLIHYLEELREYLNTRFPGRWIGRAAPIAWPPRSPDLTPLDLFYGDSLRIECSYNLYLKMSLRSELELLPAAVAEVTPEMLHSVWQDIDYRWDVCHITNESQIEP
jgi:hypothetical protein